MESLRIIEDVVRFYLNQKIETLKLKNFRHKIINNVKSYNLLSFRDIKRDAGKFLNTTDEFSRGSIVEIIQSNCKRLQESSRSLEEFLKLKDKKGAELSKQLRFFIYDLEKELIQALKKEFDLSLYAIIDTEFINIKEVEQVVKNVIQGGATLIQLCADNLDDRSFVKIAKKIKKNTSESNIPFIINNRIDIAIIIDADGIHIDDIYLKPEVARNKFYYDKIIGYSASNEKEIEKGIKNKVDYIGLEPYFLMDIKKNTVKLKVVKQIYRRYSKSIPLVIMEGFNPINIKLCAEKGIRNFAMTSAILTPENAEKITQQFKSMISKKGENK